MIDLAILVAQIEAGSDLTGVRSTEAQIGTPDPQGGTFVLVGRAKHEGQDVSGRSVPVCQQKQISRIAVQTYATEQNLAVMRNKSFNALIGEYLDFYGAEIAFEDGEIQDVVGGYANWIDVYRIDWVWDDRGGVSGTGGPLV